MVQVPNRSVFVLFVLWASGCATESELRVDESVRPTSSKVSYLAVVPVFSSEVSPTVQTLVLEEIRTFIEGSFSIKVLSGRAVGHAVWGNLDTVRLASCSEYQAALTEAKSAFSRLQFTKALSLLANSQILLPFCGAEFKTRNWYTDLFLYSGLALVSQGNLPAAEAEFRKAIAVDPEIQLDNSALQRQSQEVFERARQQLLSVDPSHLKIDSWPTEGTVYVDGKQIGSTPIAKIELYPGRHFIRIEKKGFAPWTFQTPESLPPAAILAILVPHWPKNPPLELLNTLQAKTPLQGRALEQIRILSSLLSVEAALFASFEKNEQQYSIDLQLYLAFSEKLKPLGSFSLGTEAEIPQKIKQIGKALPELANEEKPKDKKSQRSKSPPKKAKPKKKKR